MTDSSGVGDALEIGNILADCFFIERTVFDAIFAVLFRGYCLSARFAEVPGLDGSPVVGDELSVGDIHEADAVRAAFLIPVPEVFLELVRIVGSVVRFPRKLAILGFAVEVGIRSGSRQDGLDFFLIVPVGDLGKTSEVVFEREFVYNHKLSSLVEKRDFPTENIVVHRTARIPGRLAIPVRNGDEVRLKFHFGEGVFFLSEHEGDLIRSACLKREFRIFLEGSGDISDGQPGEGVVSRFQPDNGTAV